MAIDALAVDPCCHLILQWVSGRPKSPQLGLQLCDPPFQALNLCHQGPAVLIPNLVAHKFAAGVGRVTRRVTGHLADAPPQTQRDQLERDKRDTWLDR
jgi:hypothetical protein